VNLTAFLSQNCKVEELAGGEIDEGEAELLGAFAQVTQGALAMELLVGAGAGVAIDESAPVSCSRSIL
jgi:hypothetical protein